MNTSVVFNNSQILLDKIEVKHHQKIDSLYFH